MSDHIHTELEAYEQLVANNVPNIAVIVGGGDVEYDGCAQTTANQKLIKGTPNLLVRQHARLVSARVGIPLEHYQDSYVLASVVWDAFLGKCGYLWCFVAKLNV